MKNEELDKLEESAKSALDAIPRVLLDGNGNFRGMGRAEYVAPHEVLAGIEKARGEVENIRRALHQTPRRKAPKPSK